MTSAKYRIYVRLKNGIHRHELRRLAPAAIEQRICSHNTRCRGCLWLSHNADKRFYRCLGVTARQRSYFGWCNGHLSAFSSLNRMSRSLCSFLDQINTTA
jgi:hypothetical protein